MQAVNIWNKLPLHWYKIVVLGILFGLLPNDALSQRFKWARENNPN